MQDLKMFLAVLLCLGVGSVLSAERTCPDQDSIPGCYCMTMSYLFNGPFVVCGNVGTVDDLRKSLQGLKNNPVDALKLYNVSLPYLPREGLFQDMHIDYLWLSTSSFKSFAPRDLAGPSPFSGLEDSVTQLKLEFMTNFENLDWEELAILKKLVTIDINRISANVVGENFSKLPASFKNLKMFDSFVTKIDPNAFSIPNLTTISVEYNRNLTTLTRDAFLPVAKNLKELWLGKNKLTTLPDDFFQGMPSLAFLDLAWNNLSTFPTSLQTIWKQLPAVYLGSNPLRCDCDLVWLLKLFKRQQPKNSDFEFMVCNSPANLHGRNFDTLQESDLCP